QIGNDVACTNGELDVPPAPQRDDHDHRLRQPGVGDRAVGAVPADAAGVLIHRHEHGGAQVSEEDVGEKAGQVLGAVGDLALVRAPSHLPVEAHRPQSIRISTRSPPSLETSKIVPRRPERTASNISSTTFTPGTLRKRRAKPRPKPTMPMGTVTFVRTWPV